MRSTKVYIIVLYDSDLYLLKHHDETLGDVDKIFQWANIMNKLD